MATIEERRTKNGERRYRAKIRLQGHPTVTKSFRRRTDAKRWGTQTEAAIREGRDFPKPEARKRTVVDLLDRYSRDVLRRKTPSMQYNQGAQLRWWKQRLGDLFLANVSPSVVVECRDELANQKTRRGSLRSAGSVNRHLAVLSHAFSVAAKEWEWVASNPVGKVSKLREPRGRVRCLSQEEKVRLLAACKESENRYLYAVVLLTLSTGCRKEEILGLRWENVDLKRERISLHDTKNGDRRAVAVTGRALDVLHEHARLHRRLDSPLVFPRRDGKKGLNIRKPWEDALAAAKIEDFRFHDLRHSCASYLAMNGASLPEIAEILGHRSYDMVKRYAHLTDSHSADVLSRMTAKFLGNA